MSCTTTHDRDQLNEELRAAIDKGAGRLEEVQREIQLRLSEGQRLGHDCLERLLRAQAHAGLWGQIKDIHDYWGRRPKAAQGPGDLVEAAHLVHIQVLRDCVRSRRRLNEGPVLHAMEDVRQAARQIFLERTRRIYPEGSPLSQAGPY